MAGDGFIDLIPLFLGSSPFAVQQIEGKLLNYYVRSTTLATTNVVVLELPWHDSYEFRT